MSGDKNNVKCPPIRTTSIFVKLKVSADKNNVGHSTLFLSPDTSVVTTVDRIATKIIDFRMKTGVNNLKGIFLSAYRLLRVMYSNLHTFLSNLLSVLDNNRLLMFFPEVFLQI